MTFIESLKDVWTEISNTRSRLEYLIGIEGMVDDLVGMMSSQRHTRSLAEQTYIHASFISTNQPDQILIDLISAGHKRGMFECTVNLKKLEKSVRLQDLHQYYSDDHDNRLSGYVRRDNLKWEISMLRVRGAKENELQIKGHKS